MFELLIILFAAMWGILFYTYREVFSPWSVTLLVWIAVMSAYAFTDHGLYPATSQFTEAISIWVPGFCLSSYAAFHLTPAYKGVRWKQNPDVIRLLFIFTAVIAPFAFYKALSFALSSGSPADLMFNLRDQAINDKGFSLGFLGYFVHVAYVLLLVNLDRRSIDRKGLCLATILCLIFFFTTLSKQVFFMIAVSLLYLLYVYKRITLKPFLYFGAAFLFLGILFTAVRSVNSGSEETFTFMDLLVMYIVSPVSAFCYDSPESAAIWGENTFRGLYNIGNALGLTFKQPADLIQSFIYIPLPTNVYTMMSPYFKDFGYDGLLVFSVLEGAITGCIYKYAESGHNVVRLLYTYLLTMLILQYFDETFFMGMSRFLQIIVLVLLCYTKVTFGKEEKSIQPAT